VALEPQPNKVIVLKVDLLTNAFEGGKELEFEDAETFSISADVNPADDFGDITLNYEETALPLFAGGIVWMGTGEITYPAFELPGTFETQAALPVPAASDFEYAYEFTGDYFYEEYYTTVNYAALWQSIGNLQLVQEYRALNPDAKIKLYLYTPGIGIGDPAEWKWIIFIKN
jgi:hypothetical protein